MVQTAYQIALNVAFAGQIADDGFHDIQSYVNSDVVALGFGVGVKQGTADNTCLLPTAVSDVLLGITTSSFAVDNATLTGTQAVPITAAANLMRRGRLYVLPTQDITPASPVFWQTVANGSTKVAGSFRADSDGGKAIQITNAHWKTTALSGKPAVLEINLP